LQAGQWEGGVTTDSSCGMRQMQTFRNEPTTAPKTKERIEK